MREIAVSCGIVWKDMDILCCLRPADKEQGGWYEFPGGKLEKGETHEQCLARELREELHIEAKIGGFLTENRHEYDFGTVHLCVYRVLSWSGEMALTVHDDLRWVPLRELAGFPGLLPADLPVARDLEKILG